MVKVSVVIPVYNVEGYLEECLDSVINQTLRDIEIICINDGSTDSSGDILDQYAAQDPSDSRKPPWRSAERQCFRRYAPQRAGAHSDSMHAEAPAHRAARPTTPARPYE